MALIEIPGEKLLLKLWETITEKGIGGLLSPWKIRRDGRAHADVRRHEMLTLAQTERDAKDIIAGTKALDGNGRLINATPADSNITILPINASEVPNDSEEHQIRSATLLRSAAEKFSAREVLRFVNLQKIGLHAEDYARNVSDDDVSDESVDDDWLNRWRENAQDVSVEQIQAVWGRILTEEVKSPGSYSIGTLEFLRTISKNEALKIAEIGPYVLFNGTFVFRDKPFLESREISFSKLLDLQELGILSGADAVGLSWSLNSAVEDVFSNAIVAYGKVLVVDREAREPPMTLPVYRITKRGREILGLGNVMPDEEYIKHVGAQIKSLGFRVHYGDLVRNQETGAGVENAVEL